MDRTKRYITKIAREVNKFTLQTMKEDGIGTAVIRFYSPITPSSRTHPSPNS